MNNKPLVCQPKNAYTIYFNIIWYLFFFNWLLSTKNNKYSQKSKELLCGISIHIIPFFIISHYLFYYTNLPELCYGSKNIPLSYYIKKDIILHKLMLIVFLLYLNNLKDGFNYRSKYFIIGLVGVIIFLIIYAIIYEFKTNLYNISFKYLTTLYLLTLVSSLLFFKNIS